MALSVSRPAHRTRRRPRHRPLARVVVVGYDGSPSARAALSHGARRVGARGRLIVVYALPEIDARPGTRTHAAYRARYADVVAWVLEAVRAEVPRRVASEARVVARPPTQALLETADRHGANEIVIGAGDGRPAAESMDIGASVIDRARVPVAIVPAPRADRPSAPARDGAPAPEAPRARRPADPVELRGLESFPASDPPPWWASVADRGARPRAGRPTTR